MFINWWELLAWIISNHANNSNVSTVSASAATMRWKHRLLLRKMVSQAVVFHIWKQGNIVLHNNTSLPLQLFLTILIMISSTVSLQGRTESSLGNTKIRLSWCKSCFTLMILTVEKKTVKSQRPIQLYVYLFNFRRFRTSSQNLSFQMLNLHTDSIAWSDFDVSGL